MKLLFLTRGISKRGGCIVLTSLVRELRKRGYSVELVAFKRRGDEDYRHGRSFWEDLKPTIVEIPKRENENLQNAEYFMAASKYIKKNSQKYDRVISDSWFSLIATIKSGKINDNFFQLVQSDPEFVPENQSKVWEAELFSLLPRFKIRRIVVSQVLQNIFQKRYFQKTNKMQLFVRNEFFRANFKIRNIDKINLVSSSASFNIQEKGLDFLLEVLKEFSKKNKFELTLITGDPIKKNNFEKYNFIIKEETAEDAKSMVRLLKKGDIYLNASSKESFCLALAEAMAMGMPCVALDSVGNREYINDKNAKFAKNKKEFLHGIYDLMDVSNRQRIGREAKKSMKKYKLEKTIDDFEKIIMKNKAKS